VHAVRLDDVLDDAVAHDVARAEVAELDPVDVAKDLLDGDEAGALPGSSAISATRRG